MVVLKVIMMVDGDNDDSDGGGGDNADVGGSGDYDDGVRMMVMVVVVLVIMVCESQRKTDSGSEEENITFSSKCCGTFYWRASYSRTFEDEINGIPRWKEQHKQRLKIRISRILQRTKKMSSLEHWMEWRK